MTIVCCWRLPHINYDFSYAKGHFLYKKRLGSSDVMQQLPAMFEEPYRRHHHQLKLIHYIHFLLHSTLLCSILFSGVLLCSGLLFFTIIVSWRFLFVFGHTLLRQSVSLCSWSVANYSSNISITRAIKFWKSGVAGTEIVVHISRIYKKMVVQLW